MADDHDSDEEIEESRRQALAELDKSRLDQYAPGSFGCHEVLHVAWLMQDLVYRRLLEHPAVILNPGWYRRVHRAGWELAALYQEIGAVHLSGDDDNPHSESPFLKKPRMH